MTIVAEHDLLSNTNHKFLLDCLVCSCNHFCIHGIPCRHIYCILQRFPEITDCNIKQFKAFESFLGRDEKITAVLSNEVTSALKGPLVGDSFNIQPNSRQCDDINWFNEAMDRIVLRPGVLSYSSMETYASISQVTNRDVSSDEDNHFGNDDDDNESYNEEVDKKVKSPFHSLQPTMAGIYDLIENESDLFIATEHLNNLRSQLLEKKRGKVQAGTGITSTVSFPEIDQRRFDTRKRPATSPDRKRSNRK